VKNPIVRWLILGGGLAAIWPVLPASLAAEFPPVSGSGSQTRVLDWNTGANKSYIIAAAEITGFLGALNLFNRSFLDKTVYGSNGRTAWKNLRNLSLDYDADPFNVNQFGHPTEGPSCLGRRGQPASVSGNPSFIATRAVFSGKLRGRQSRPVSMI